MFNINDFTTNTPVVALQKAMQQIRGNIEASFEDQLFIALLAAVQGKASDDSIVYLSELIEVNAHTKKCLIDESLVESLSKKGFLSAIRKNRAFWSDVLQGNILKFELEDRINDLKAKLGMHNKTLAELCFIRLEAEKQANAEKLAEAGRVAQAKEARKQKRLADKEFAEAKLAEAEYQKDLQAQARQVQLVEEQVQAKLQLVEAYAVEDAVQKALELQAALHAQEAKKLEDKIEAYRSVKGIQHLITMLEDAERQELLTALATKYPAATSTKRGKGAQTQPTLPV